MTELTTVVCGIAIVMAVPSLLAYMFVLYKNHEYKEKVALKAERDARTAKLRAELRAIK